MLIEKHGRGAEQARQMLDTFASLGVKAFDFTATDIDGHKQNFRAGQRLEQLRQCMPALIESAIKRQHNLIVRPQGVTVQLVQLDDLSRARLDFVRSLTFLTLATSAGNHQAWLGVPECVPDWARRLRRGSGADPNASGATRVAGSRNFKRKYAPDFPMVEILEAVPQRTASKAELEAAGLVAPPDPIPVTRTRPNWRAKAWPSYERCMQNAPLAHDSDRPDISRADFTFCLLAIDWGWSIEDTCERLLEKTGKAREKGEAYAWLTVQRAAAAVDRRQRGRGNPP